MPRTHTKAHKVSDASGVTELLEALQSIATDGRANPRTAVALARKELETRPRAMIAAILRQETALLMTLCSLLERNTLKKFASIVDDKGKLNTASAELLKVQGKLHQTTLALARVEGIPATVESKYSNDGESGDVASIIQSLDETE